MLRGAGNPISPHRKRCSSSQLGPWLSGSWHFAECVLSTQTPERHRLHETHSHWHPYSTSLFYPARRRNQQHLKGDEHFHLSFGRRGNNLFRSGVFMPCTIAPFIQTLLLSRAPDSERLDKIRVIAPDSPTCHRMPSSFVRDSGSVCSRDVWMLIFSLCFYSKCFKNDGSSSSAFDCKGRNTRCGFRAAVMRPMSTPPCDGQWTYVIPANSCGHLRLHGGIVLSACGWPLVWFHSETDRYT